VNVDLGEMLRSDRAAGLHGVVVLRGGAIELEHYGVGEDVSIGRALGTVVFGPEVLHDVRSVTKSIVGLLYGIALRADLVPAPDAPLLPQFPEYDDLASDERRLGLLVEHALTMSLGLEWNEGVPYTSPENSEIAMELAPDRLRFVLERPIVEEPGTTWHYCGGATALLGRLIERGSGRALQEFARTSLFEPLGIERFEWTTGSDGVALAASGLRLAPRDLARIGQVVLEGGRLADVTLVPGSWLRTALSPRLGIEDDFQYGYQWYLGKFPTAGAGVRWVGAIGNGGQRLYVVPEQKLVVSIAAGNYDAEDQSDTPSAVMDALLATTP
jgi:CubicO group peptidase (beta-lactamase class C family)